MIMEKKHLKMYPLLLRRARRLDAWGEQELGSQAFSTLYFVTSQLSKGA
jgi:hypothetical protein